MQFRDIVFMKSPVIVSIIRKMGVCSHPTTLPPIAHHTTTVCNKLFLLYIFRHYILHISCSFSSLVRMYECVCVCVGVGRATRNDRVIHFHSRLEQSFSVILLFNMWKCNQVLLRLLSLKTDWLFFFMCVCIFSSKSLWQAKEAEKKCVRCFLPQTSSLHPSII